MTGHTVETLHALVAFSTDQDFLINFVANLIGALVGVTLAFGIERWRARRDAANLYGRVLSACHYELNYSGAVRLPLPATKAALLNPVVQERAPHSLIQILIVLVATADNRLIAEERGFALRGDRTRLDESLEREGQKLRKLVPFAVERLNHELASLRLTRRPDPEGEALRQRLLGIIRSDDAKPPSDSKLPPAV